MVSLKFRSSIGIADDEKIRADTMRIHVHATVIDMINQKLGTYGYCILLPLTPTSVVRLLKVNQLADEMQCQKCSTHFMLICYSFAYRCLLIEMC